MCHLYGSVLSATFSDHSIDQAFFVTFASFAMTGVHHGTGQHAWDIKPAFELPIALKVSLR